MHGRISAREPDPVPLPHRGLRAGGPRGRFSRPAAGLQPASISRCCRRSRVRRASAPDPARGRAVLMPEGHAVIACFNPWSLWGLRRHLRGGYPWMALHQLAAVKDWLALLGLEDRGRADGLLCPACAAAEMARALRVHGGRRRPLVAIAGGVYFLQAVKRVRGLRIIMPKWSDRRREEAACGGAQPRRAPRRRDRARDNGGPA